MGNTKSTIEDGTSQDGCMREKESAGAKKRESRRSTVLLTVKLAGQKKGFSQIKEARQASLDHPPNEICQSP